MIFALLRPLVNPAPTRNQTPKTTCSVLGPPYHHDGILFKEIHVIHHKALQVPLCRSILAWNELPSNIRIVDVKDEFKRTLLETIPDPYKKVA